LLEPARKAFDPNAGFKEAYERALELLRTEQVRQIEQTVAVTAKRMLGFLGRDVASSIEISFGFADPANPFNSLRLQYREAGLEVPGEELGLGIQSAMVVGIFEAFRQLGENFGTVIIEEPEMYLHPQAQRYFHRLLCEMAESGQCQVIYSTHSPIFADVNQYEAIRLVRKEPGQNARVSFVRPESEAELKEARDRFKLGGKFDIGRNEVLFASRALLVEGYGDRIAALMIAEKLNLDPDAEGVSIIDCGGKAGIELVVRVCRALEIPFVVLHDEDVWPTEDIDDPKQRQKQVEENEAEEKKNERIKNAVGQDGIVFVISPSLENALGISRNASDKPRRVAEEITKLALDKVPEELQPLIEAVKALVPPRDARVTGYGANDSEVPMS
jgi:predicted ATP-dependent endonuclease of OLD family